MRIIVLCIMLLFAPVASLSLAAERELKVGFIYVSPVGDAGWSHAHEQARQVNARLTSEVHDLKEGLDMVEEKARSELGMVKPNEIFVQFTPR